MTRANLEQLLLDESEEAASVAVQVGLDAVPILERMSGHERVGVRLETMYCAEALLASKRAETAHALIPVLTKSLTDADEQIASLAATLLYQIEPDGVQNELRVAFAKTTHDFVKARIPMIASFSASPEDRNYWEAILPFQKDSSIVEGLNCGLARMGYEPSRTWFCAKLDGAQGTDCEEWFDRAVKLGGEWVYPTLRRCMTHPAVAFTVRADFDPEDVLVRDLAAWAFLKMSKEKVDFAVAKRRFKSTELERVQAIASKYGKD